MKNPEPCWCYTGEISTCGDCDREYIALDIQTYRALPLHIKIRLGKIKREQKKARKKDTR